MASTQINTLVDEETAQRLADIERDFGPKPPAIVRLALADFLPRYMAAEGRSDHMEIFAQLGAAMKRSPGLKDEVEKLIRNTIRLQRRKAA